MTTPSSTKYAILRRLVGNDARLLRHGTGAQCGSISQGDADGKASMYRSILARLQLMGPATERTMSCPGLSRVSTGVHSKRSFQTDENL